MLFICYSRCGTCRKAKKWLDDNGYEYEERDIKTQPPTYEELKDWHSFSGLPVKRPVIVDGEKVSFGFKGSL